MLLVHPNNRNSPTLRIHAQNVTREPMRKFPMNDWNAPHECRKKFEVPLQYGARSITCE